MSRWWYAFRTWRFFWRTNLPSVAAVGVATTVLIGALLVGNSVRSSLQQIGLARLGPYKYCLASPRPFHQSLAESVTSRSTIAPAAILYLPRAVVESLQDGTTDARSTGVGVLGVDDQFWQDNEIDLVSFGAREAVLNERLARDLAVDVGATLVVRLPLLEAIPSDSPLGRKHDTVRNVAQITVRAVIPDKSIGSFELFPSHQPSRNVFLRRDTLQEALGQPDNANLLLVPAEDDESSTEGRTQLDQRLATQLSDYGVQWQDIQRRADGTTPSPEADSGDGGGTNEELESNYWQVTSTTMILEPAIDAAVRETIGKDGLVSLTYLANSIRRREGPIEGKVAEIPYSTITALGPDPRRCGPLRTLDAPQDRLADGDLKGEATAGQLADDQIVLNRWAADRLGAHVGDELVVTYFAPETTHGETEERNVTFRLRAILDLTEPSQPYRRNRTARFRAPPVPANDPWLTPEVAGVTDQESVSSWDPPFPFDASRMDREDDEYWKSYRATPKAFIGLATGRRLWGSRFGESTGYRVPASDAATRRQVRDKLLTALQARNEAIGFQFRDLRHEISSAAGGTTPFDVLFLMFSGFIVAAALMLMALLFRLATEQRATQLGLWKAVGATHRRLRATLMRESAITIVCGTLLGIGGGLAYGWLLVYLLRTWWVAAVASPFVTYRVDTVTLLAGAAFGAIFSWATLRWSTRVLGMTSPLSLIDGHLDDQPDTSRRPVWLVTVVLLSAAVVALAGTQLTGEMQAATFLGSGALIVWGLLLLLRRKMTTRRESTHPMTVYRLATSWLQTHPTQTMLTAALTGWASFLIVSVSMFHVEPSLSGTGGFRLWADSTQPIFENLNNNVVRAVQGQEFIDQLAGTRIFSLRLVTGEEASCRNLYRTTRPRILGLSDSLIDYLQQPDRTQFHWGMETDRKGWTALRDPISADVIPVVIDQNTARYALRLYRGIGEEFTVRYDAGREVRFRVVGLLANSLLQGSLMVHEQQLLDHFPDTAGYQYFLIDAPDERVGNVTRQLESHFGDQGLDVHDAQSTLGELLAVQNTYLSSFQSLGLLGMLLGTAGLAAVQIRSVMRRRSQLALLAAIGFPHHRLRSLLLRESLTLLVIGLAVGTIAAASAVFPHAAQTGGGPPIGTISLLLASVLASGLVASWLATIALPRHDLLNALRSE